MDENIVNFSAERYYEIKKQMIEQLNKIGFAAETIPFIPISGYNGDNMVERSPSAPWYEGPTLLEALDTLEPPKKPIDKPLRFPLQDVYKIGGVGTVPVGRVESGIIKPGMLIQFAPGNIQAECKTFETHHEPLTQGVPGDTLGFSVDVEQKHLFRG